MDPLLFSIHATPHPKGMGKPSVRAIPPGAICGLYDEQSDAVWRPDPDAVRAALPHQWRKAWDRSGGNFWYTRDARFLVGGRTTVGSMPYITLRNARGHHLATIYAIPYRYKA